MKEQYTKAFTLVFHGDIRSFEKNPFVTDSPWGRPYAASMGDVLEENDELRDLLEASPLPPAEGRPHE